jgi:hypothetical protein
VEYRLVTTDQYGNVTNGAASTSKYAKPKGTFNITAAATATYETAGTASWRGDTDDVISGYADGTYAMQTGCWFYGTSINDTCKGYAPDSATLLFARSGSQGYSGNVWFQGITNTASPGGTTAPTTVGSSDTGPNMVGADDVVQHPLPAGMRTNMGNNTLKGFAIIHTDVPGAHAHAGSQTCYRRLKGLSSNSLTGLIAVTYT